MYINNQKTLYDFDAKELEMFPIDVLLQRVRPWELLDNWYKIPKKYKGNFELQIRLPCFVHYNRPDACTHVDGPAPAQQNCHGCNCFFLKIE